MNRNDFYKDLEFSILIAKMVLNPKAMKLLIDQLRKLLDRLESDING